MRHHDIAIAARERRERKLPWSDSLARRGLLGRLNSVRRGRMVVREGGREHRFGMASERWPLDVTVDITDPRAWAEIALGGALGAGEAYMRGWWKTDDLTGVVRLFLVNRDVLESMDSGAARLLHPVFRLAHRLNRNTRRGSRRNIQAHYDLGDDLFRLFLDDTMMYSAAVFDEQHTTLEEASRNKIRLLCEKLHLAPGHRLLEIGSGWGALAVHAAKEHGCRVTTVTLSDNQLAAVRRRAEAEGVADRVDARLCDYRDLDGSWDRIVSVEMLEAVGHEYFETYFRKVDDLLAEDGLMVLQTITIADQNYEHARRSVDFIKRYIFPGGGLPSVTAMLDIMSR
ncbi:MAG TPA: cyclopropane-fatty-acyl-phospholipid synthase family protein, partial [Woeseiaceae bacterium]|nr:cyclopropane-fatty-acyl-phospholipid synthase family protein [Woeseiaceae bacterium]